MAPRSLRGVTSRSPLGVWRPRPIQVCFPAGSHAGPPWEQPLFSSDQQCMLSCMFQRRWHVGLGFFFIKIYEACPLLNTPLLQLPSLISRIGVNKRVFSPLLALVSLLRQGVVTCAAYFPFCFDTAVKVFLSFEIDIAIVYSIEQYRYG